jgi:hypothetical protein
LFEKIHNNDKWWIHIGNNKIILKNQNKTKKIPTKKNANFYNKEYDYIYILPKWVLVETTKNTQIYIISIHFLFAKVCTPNCGSVQIDQKNLQHNLAIK